MRSGPQGVKQNTVLSVTAEDLNDSGKRAALRDALEVLYQDAVTDVVEKDPDALNNPFTQRFLIALDQARDALNQSGDIDYAKFNASLMDASKIDFVANEISSLNSQMQEVLAKPATPTTPKKPIEEAQRPQEVNAQQEPEQQTDRVKIISTEDNDRLMGAAKDLALAVADMLNNITVVTQRNVLQVINVELEEIEKQLPEEALNVQIRMPEPHQVQQAEEMTPQTQTAKPLDVSSFMDQVEDDEFVPPQIEMPKSPDKDPSKKKDFGDAAKDLVNKMEDLVDVLKGDEPEKPIVKAPKMPKLDGINDPLKKVMKGAKPVAEAVKKMVESAKGVGKKSSADSASMDVESVEKTVTPPAAEEERVEPEKPGPLPQIKLPKIKGSDSSLKKEFENAAKDVVKKMEDLADVLKGDEPGAPAKEERVEPEKPGPLPPKSQAEMETIKVEKTVTPPAAKEERVDPDPSGPIPPLKPPKIPKPEDYEDPTKKWKKAAKPFMVAIIEMTQKVLDGARMEIMHESTFTVTPAKVKPQKATIIKDDADPNDPSSDPSSSSSDSDNDPSVDDGPESEASADLGGGSESSTDLDDNDVLPHLPPPGVSTLQAGDDPGSNSTLIAGDEDNARWKWCLEQAQRLIEETTGNPKEKLLNIHLVGTENENHRLAAAFYYNNSLQPESYADTAHLDSQVRQLYENVLDATNRKFLIPAMAKLGLDVGLSKEHTLFDRIHDFGEQTRAFYDIRGENRNRMALKDAVSPDRKRGTMEDAADKKTANQQFKDMKNIHDDFRRFKALASVVVRQGQEMLYRNENDGEVLRLSENIKGLKEQLEGYYKVLQDLLTKEGHEKAKGHCDAGLKRWGTPQELVKRREEVRKCLDQVIDTEDALITLKEAKPKEWVYYNSADAGKAQELPADMDPESIKTLVETYLGAGSDSEFNIESGDIKTTAECEQRFIPHSIMVPKFFGDPVESRMGVVETVDKDRTFSKQQVHLNSDEIKKMKPDDLMKIASELVRTGLATARDGPISIKGNCPENLGKAIAAYCRFKGIEFHSEDPKHEVTHEQMVKITETYRKGNKSDIGIIKETKLADKTETMRLHEDHADEVTWRQRQDF